MAERIYSKSFLETLSDADLETLRQQARAKIPSSVEGTAVAGGIGVLGAAATVAADKLQDMAGGDESPIIPLGWILTGVVGAIALEEGVKTGVNIARVNRIDKIQQRRATQAKA